MPHIRQTKGHIYHHESFIPSTGGVIYNVQPRQGGGKPSPVLWGFEGLKELAVVPLHALRPCWPRLLMCSRTLEKDYHPFLVTLIRFFGGTSKYWYCKVVCVCVCVAIFFNHVICMVLPCGLCSSNTSVVACNVVCWVPIVSLTHTTQLASVLNSSLPPY